MPQVTIACTENRATGDREYVLRIPASVFIRANLDHIDMMLIRECEKSEKVEDKLLALETIVRRCNSFRLPPDVQSTNAHGEKTRNCVGAAQQEKE